MPTLQFCSTAKLREVFLRAIVHLDRGYAGDMPDQQQQLQLQLHGSGSDASGDVGQLASSIQRDLRASFRSYIHGADGDPVLYSDIRYAMRLLRFDKTCPNDLRYAHILLRSCRPYDGPPLTQATRPPRSPELDRRLNKIRNKLDQEAYDAMLGVVGQEEREERARTDESMSSVFVSVTSSLNVFITTIALFFVGRFIGQRWSPELGMVVGAFFAVGAFLIEAVLLVIRAYREDALSAAKEKRRLDPSAKPSKTAELPAPSAAAAAKNR